MRITIITACAWSGTYIDGVLRDWDEKKDFSWPDDLISLLETVRKGGGHIEEMAHYDLGRSWPGPWKTCIPRQLEDAMRDFTVYGEQEPLPGIPEAEVRRY